jgi:hypothetical protein
MLNDWGACGVIRYSELFEDSELIGFSELIRRN